MTVGARAAAVDPLLPVTWLAKNKRDPLDQIAEWPEGSAKWHLWRCENKRWRVMRSHRVVGGPLHGKYIVMVFFFKDDLWEVRYERVFSTRKAAITADNRHYGRHSPKWLALNPTT